jgi:arylsulfatase A-like enzyme
VEPTVGKTGGYTDADGTPTAPLLGEIQYVDAAIGKMVAALQAHGLYQSTAIISAKHGQSPIDPNRVLRIPADAPSDKPPSGVLPANSVAQALEDDVSLLWLTINTAAATASAVSTLAMTTPR